jgi:hypothetical protein
MNEFVKVTHAQNNKEALVNISNVRLVEMFSKDVWILHFDIHHIYKVKPSDTLKEVLGLAEVLTETLDIVTVKAGRTSNSESRMWRCYDVEGNQINFFQHEDTSKNTFPLLETAGYADFFLDMREDEILMWHDNPIRVEYVWEGKWRNPVCVDSRDGAAPDSSSSVLNRVNQTGDLLAEETGKMIHPRQNEGEKDG